jgi:hypothetical protein
MALLAVLALPACASVKGPKVPERFKPPKKVKVDMDQGKLKKSAQSPLYDLNVMRERIPRRLKNIKYVYALDQPVTCDDLDREIAGLDAVLGPDPADTTKARNETLTLETSDALEQAIDSFIPFTSVIRYLSGASDHEKRLAAAYYRGEVRRAFLKGTRTQLSCNIPVPRPKP